MDEGDDLMDELMHMDPESPALQAIQGLISDQLNRQNQEYLLQIKEAEEKIKRANVSRETVGVELYNSQQQLAKLQDTLEKAHDNLNTISKIREEFESRRDSVLEVATQRKNNLENQRKKFYEYQAEADKLSAKLIRIEKYNEQIVSDIAVKRRQAYKTEEQMEKIEKTKRDQDILIDRMTEQIRDIEKQISVLNSQIQEQQQEKEVAKNTLAEAISEMEATKFEKKGLIQQWKSSLVGMQRRDQALEATENGLRLQKEQIKEIQNEIEGYKNSINAEKDKHEKLTSILMKHENEKKYLETKTDDISKELEDRENQYANLKTTLEQTEEQARKEEQNGRVIQIEISSLESKIAKTSNDIRELENGLLQLFSEQTTFKKDYQSTLNAIQKKRDLIRDKEVDAAQLANELARIKVDELQTNDHNKALKGILAELEKELEQKDSLIEKYEMEIRRKHDEIERKQSHLDKLNRQYEKLIANQQEENFGPLEATINNISKAINRTTRTNEQLKRDWTRYQSELVELVNESDKLSEELRSIQSKQMVLSQKKARLENASVIERSEFKKLELEMAHMHTDLNKLSQMISKNSRLQQLLADANYDKENEILDRLREKEHEARNLEVTISNIREEKRIVLDELIDVERQIMYWEKKIEIQKEIQDALDPEVGQEEIRRMKKEIHLMEQTLLELRRAQKMKLKEMEKAVSKRDVILTKGKVASSNKNKTNTRAQIHREEANLSQELEKRKQMSQKTLSQIKRHQNEAQDSAQQISRLEDELRSGRNEMNRLREQIETMNIEKSRIGNEKDRLKEMVRRYQLVLKGGQYKYDIRSDEHEQALNEADRQRQLIVNIVQQLQQEYGKSRDQLQVVLKILLNEESIQ